MLRTYNKNGLQQYSYKGFSIYLTWKDGNIVSTNIMYAYKPGKVEFLALRNQYLIDVLEYAAELAGRALTLFDNKQQAQGLANIDGQLISIVGLDSQIMWGVVK